MPIWLLNLLPLLWHAIKRFASVLFIGAAIFILIYVPYKQGYHKGYAAAIKERPTYGNVGTVVNQPAEAYKLVGLRITLWKFHIGAGY